MKTYRIITNGKTFRVQKQGLFGGWNTEGYSTANGYGPFKHYEFDTMEDAREFILSRHVQIVGADPDAVGEREPWRVTE